MPATHPAPDPLWYKDAVIYQLHVKSFFDANDDGVGDFAGLLAKLDYIVELGVNTIWLLPFYPSPRRDDGYDIADYRGVHPDYGSLADARLLVRAAHARGLRVITELVINHTSDQHPWFQRARAARPGSAHRAYYVWSDDDKAYAGTRIIFCDTEKSNWTWDPVTGAYFWHRFYSHQPDLNYDNPQVLREVLGAMRYWLDMGVDGLRLDAVPYLVEREGTNNENLPETHAILRRIRRVIDSEYPGRMLLAEANQWPEDAQEYFGAGDECHMAFHFPLMPRMYMAIAQEDRLPVTDIIRQTPSIAPQCQWAIFLRNHDELTLEMVTSRERDYLWNVYAAEPRARINLGIRRRLAPLLERDRRRIELMNSLLLSMPGTPVLYYGDELGMGDNIHLGDRDGVRTPMQWSPDRNGGFSRADPERLPLPLLMGPLYGYEAVNVEAQQRDPHSLLNWTRRMLAKRRQSHVFGRGELSFLYPGNRKILAYLRTWEDTVVLCVANLSQAAQPVELHLSEYAGRVPVEMLGGTAFPQIGELPYLLTLPPFGFYWLDLSAGAAPPAWHSELPPQMPESITLVSRGAGAALRLTEASRRQLEADVLPAYLQRQRWYAARRKPGVMRLAYSVPLNDDVESYYEAEIEVSDDGPPRRFHTPVALAWQDDTAAQYPLARVRRGAQLGTLTDASLQPGYARVLLAALTAGRDIQAGGEPAVRLRFLPEPGLADLALRDDSEVRALSADQSNSSLLVGERVVFKLLRELHAGPHPEAEMTRYLTQAGYAHTPALLGEVVRVQGDQAPHTLALAHAYVVNEGDAWNWTVAYLKRTLDAAILTGASADDYQQELAGYEVLAGTIGQRLAQMHSVLARAGELPGFAPRPASERDAALAGERAVAQLDRALQALRACESGLAPASHACAQWLFEHRDRLAAHIMTLAQAETGALRIRVHGDFHLGQILVAQTDAYLIDFEGEPARPMAERRQLSSPFKDVAGILRSFDYAVAELSRDDPLGGAPRDFNTGVAEPADPASAPRETREALLARFRQRAGAALLASYGNAIDPVLALPPERAQALTCLYLLEKAAYEICYESAYRPERLPVPIHGLAETARAALLAAAVDHDEGPAP